MFTVRRRTVLLAPLVVVTGHLLGGCTDKTIPVARNDPDREAVGSALTVETGLLQLAAQWSDAGDFVANPQTVVAVLTTHVDVLSKALGTTIGAGSSAAASPSSGSSSSAMPRATAATLQIRAGQAARSHTRALLSISGPAAQLLASIAASDIAVADSLRAVR